MGAQACVLWTDTPLPDYGPVFFGFSFSRNGFSFSTPRNCGGEKLQTNLQSSSFRLLAFQLII